MLKSLKIASFKSIYRQTIDFGAVNLFIGPNGSGKSNILEALGVLSAALSSGLEPTTLDLRGVRLSLPHLFKSAFKNHDLPQTFRLEAQFEHGRYECSIRSGQRSEFLEFFSEALYDGNSQVFGRSAHGTKLHSVARFAPGFDKNTVASTRSVWSVIEPIVQISDGLRSELDQFARYAIYAPQTAIMRGLAIDQRVVEPLGLTGSGLAKAFRALQDERPADFNQILSIIWEPGWTDQVITGGFNSAIVPAQVRSEGLLLYLRDKYMRHGRDMLSAFDASEGTLYLIFVATLLSHVRTPKVFALDNVDGTLNPKLVRKLSKYIVDTVRPENQLGRQAFMTSHHPSALDSFDIFDGMQKVFVCSRGGATAGNAVGSTRFRPLSPPEGVSKEEWAIKHKGKNLSELLLENRIEGAL